MTGGRPFDAVLCHGVLMYLSDPAPRVEALCACAAPNGRGVGARAQCCDAGRPPRSGRRWQDERAAFDAHGERGVLGLEMRADTLDDLSRMLTEPGVVRRLAVHRLDVTRRDRWQLTRIADAELEASRHNPYLGLSRAIHLLDRKSAHIRRCSVTGSGSTCS